MALAKHEFEEAIKNSFENANFTLVDLVGDGDHYELTIKSPEFANLKTLQIHRIINERLKDYIGTKVHALTIKIEK